MDILGLLPQAGSLVWTVLFFVLALSIIVFIHEYGHYIVGRWSGIHAEVFSLGFGPVLLSRMDSRGTRWQLAAIPFGGFVKFLGDADAASGKDGAAMSALTAEERRHTMHGAPLWARSATVAAGPVFNFILTLVIFIGMIAVLGVPSDTPVVGEVRATAFQGPTLQTGDRILAINGTDTPDNDTLYALIGDLPPSATVNYRVDRGGETVEFAGPHPFPPMISTVQTKSAAMDAGLLAGDVIVSIDGTPVSAFTEMPAMVAATGAKPLSLVVWRDGTTFEATLTPRSRDLPKADGGFETRFLIGLNGAPLFSPQTRTPGVGETLTLAAQQTWSLAVTTLSGIWHIITGAISSCNISGPIGMATVMGDAARSGVESFVTMIAVLSLGIGLMNLFPIPVLDGGHLVFHAFEAVTGKPPSDRALRVLMTVGLTLILSLMVFAITNDLFCV